jgi:hypothetical protein
VAKVSDLTQLRRAWFRAHFALKKAETLAQGYRDKVADLEARIQVLAPDLQLTQTPQIPARTWGSSSRAPERTAGPPLGDSEIPLKRPVGGRGPNLQHQMSASW